MLFFASSCHRTRNIRVQDREDESTLLNMDNFYVTLIHLLKNSYFEEIMDEDDEDLDRGRSVIH